jgi:hypothetical protein
MDKPPFALKTVDGSWKGLSIGLLDMIARDLGLEYELVEYDSFAEILAAVEKGKVDVVTALAVTAPRETIVDFSHPILSTGSAIAVPVPVSRPGLFDFTFQLNPAAAMMSGTSSSLPMAMMCTPWHIFSSWMRLIMRPAISMPLVMA